MIQKTAQVFTGLDQRQNNIHIYIIGHVKNYILLSHIKFK